MDLMDKKTDIMKVRQNVGMVFQHFHLFPHKTVMENITYAPMKVKKVSKAEAEKKANGIIRHKLAWQKRHPYTQIDYQVVKSNV